MPLSLSDINFHHLTQQEAQQIESELNGMYPDLNPTAVQSNAWSGFFENHIYLFGGTALLLAGAYYMHTQTSFDLQRRMNVLL